jgi:hypothetical protein
MLFRVGSKRLSESVDETSKPLFLLPSILVALLLWLLGALLLWWMW